MSSSKPSASEPLAFTGERFTPETPGEIWYEHWHRYSTVLPLARGKRVLDAACGEGYGSGLLAAVATELVGVDVSAAAIAHAAARYGDKGRARFVRASVTALPIAAASIDLIVSFETVEHLREQEAMLAEFRRVLTPAGLLAISSPNKPVYSDQRQFQNEFHLRELTRDELAMLLAPGFPRQRWYGQSLQFHSLIWPEVQDQGLRALETLTVVDGQAGPALQAPAPMYFLVICGGAAASPPEADRISLFADREQSIYREFERVTRSERKLYQMYLEQEQANQHLLGELAKLSAERDALQLALAHRAAPGDG